MVHLRDHLVAYFARDNIVERVSIESHFTATRCISEGVASLPRLIATHVLRYAYADARAHRAYVDLVSAYIHATIHALGWSAGTVDHRFCFAQA